eukprot:11210560-Lingulodinium_polyedra.AAC.1
MAAAEQVHSASLVGTTSYPVSRKLHEALYGAADDEVELHESLQNQQAATVNQPAAKAAKTEHYELVRELMTNNSEIKEIAKIAAQAAATAVQMMQVLQQEKSNASSSSHDGVTKSPTCADKGAPAGPTPEHNEQQANRDSSPVSATVPTTPFQEQGLPERINKHIAKTASNFGKKNIQKFIRISTHIEKAKADLGILSLQPRQYPAGIRPFKCPGDIVELENQWSMAAAADYVFTITIPKGSSRREAMETVHHAYSRFHRC